MNNHKIKFIALLLVESGLIAVHLALTQPKTGIENNTLSVLTEWHFWLGLIFGYYVIYYMFTLACPKCGYKQIWRSHNCWDWRLPEEKCWNCSHDLNDAE